MNRKNLTAAVLAGLAGVAGIASTAQAVNLNPDGLGQVLIYPYYTVRGGNNTLLSVVNTTDNAKAVKVRFLEGKNSREVLDFNLYLSPWDVWVAEIALDGDTPRLHIPDSSCTVPYLFETKPNGQEFLTFAMDDVIGPDIERATEGHFEMIEMGTLLDVDEGSATAATHVPDPDDPTGTNTARPLDCGQLVAAWSTTGGVDGYWKDGEADEDISAPSGGLFGGAAIINVDNGTMFAYDARAIEGFFAGNIPDNGPNTTNLPVHFLHSNPGSEVPSLNSGDVLTAHMFFDSNGDNVPDPLSVDYLRGVDAVSAVFMHAAIMNEFTSEAKANANSEWVVTFPTKRFYVDPDFANDGVLGFTAPVEPFTEAITSNGACEELAFDIWDREERPVEINEGVVVSPAPPDPETPVFELCWETQVVRFGGDEIVVGTDDTEILGSINATNLDSGLENGWSRFDFTSDINHVLFDENQGNGGIILAGLPVTGFWVERFANGKAAGATTVRNYAGLFNHKGTRELAIQ